MEKWTYGESTIAGDYKIFHVCKTPSKSPRTGTEFQFFTIRSKDWVDIIAQTDDETVVMVKQFRHGARDFSLELPAGTVEHGEDVVQAGLRELNEETGYGALKASYLGSFKPNAAIMENQCHVIEVTDRKSSFVSQNLDDGEDIEVVKVPIADIQSLICSGEISSAPTIAALALFFARKNRLPTMGQ